MQQDASPPDPSLPPWPQYAEAVVEFVLEDAHVVLTPCAASDAVAHALAPWGAPVWVLTAGDPYPLQLTRRENAQRNAELKTDIERLGLRHHPALGRAPDDSTFERSVAVRDTTRADMLALARRYGQLAVYEIDDRIRCVDVATAHVVTSTPFQIVTSPVTEDDLMHLTGREEDPDRC